MKHILLRAGLAFCLLVVFVAGSAGPVQADEGILIAPGDGGFSYQGQLQKNGFPYTGTCDFTFSLWNSAVNGTQQGTTQTIPGVAVNKGLFSVILNESGQFGVLNGAPRWLEISVKCSGDSAAVLLGRQKLTGSPYSLNKLQADSYYLNNVGPDSMSGESFTSILTVTQTGSGHGISGSATSYQSAGVYGWGVFSGVWGTATGGYPGAGVSGLGYNGSLGGYFRTDHENNDSLMVDGNARVQKNLRVVGDLNITGTVSAPIIRYVPITVGDLVTSQAPGTGDSSYGLSFSSGTLGGGSATFPLPEDYEPGTPLTLDLFLVPSTGQLGGMSFFVRLNGQNAGDFSTTGSSYTAPPVAITTSSASKIFKQTFTHPGFSAQNIPDFVVLTVRRDPSTDTYPAAVTLTALRLSYQASR